MQNFAHSGPVHMARSGPLGALSAPCKASAPSEFPADYELSEKPPERQIAKVAQLVEQLHCKLSVVCSIHTLGSS